MRFQSATSAALLLSSFASADQAITTASHLTINVDPAGHTSHHIRTTIRIGQGKTKKFSELKPGVTIIRPTADWYPPRDVTPTAALETLPTGLNVVVRDEADAESASISSQAWVDAVPGPVLGLATTLATSTVKEGTSTLKNAEFAIAMPPPPTVLMCPPTNSFCREATPMGMPTTLSTVTHPSKTVEEGELVYTTMLVSPSDFPLISPSDCDEGQVCL